MSLRKIFRRGLVAVFCAGSLLAVQQPQEPIPPGLVRAREARNRFEQEMSADRVQPARQQPDWNKAQEDAAKLLALAQQVHQHVQASQLKVPAGLNDELKQLEKLSKRLRQDLLL